MTTPTMHLAIYSKSLHLVECEESFFDLDHFEIRYRGLLSAVQSRGDDWIVYRSDKPFDWDLVGHKETPEELTERLANKARAKRDRLIVESDKYLLPDWPLPVDTTRTAWTTTAKAYRQALRDIPEQEGFPSSITWPVDPSEAPVA